MGLIEIKNNVPGYKHPRQEGGGRLAKKYYWLKLKDDWFNSKVIKKLRKIAGGDTYTIIYLKMLLLSLKNEGKLYYEGVEESFSDELALELDEETDNVNVTISFLQSCGLIEIVDPDEYVLTEVPLAIGSETESAERMRKCRANKNKKLLEQKASHCDGTVTVSDTEIEIEKEIEIKKENNICTEQKCSEPEPEPIIKLPLNTGEEYPIFQRNIDEFAELYPAVDVLQAMRGMRGWLLTNPAKRKTKRGINRFINSWLSREQDKGGNRGYYKKSGTETKNDFNQFMKQEYDFKQIEKEILSNN